MSIELSRRGFLAGAAAIVASPALPTARAAQPAGNTVPPVAKRPLRIAHLTDFHIQPELAADQGVIAALRDLQSKHKVDLVLTGGDHVMDSFDAEHARTKLQWDLYSKAMKDECSIPVKSVIGNHDVWGWNKAKSKATGEEARYGKKWVLEIFGRGTPYASFDQGAWHFILLDSITQKDDGYIGKLDDEQFAWLEADLKAVKEGSHVCIVSHIPIFAACSIIPGSKTETDASVKINGAKMHSDMPRLTALFRKHPAVKLCLAGHIHMNDEANFRGVTYMVNGAVCGAWWKANADYATPGYATLDLSDDGTFTREYHTFGWQFKS